MTPEKLKYYFDIRGDVDFFDRSGDDVLSREEFNEMDNLIDDCIIVLNGVANTEFEKKFKNRLDSQNIDFNDFKGKVDKHFIREPKRKRLRNYVIHLLINVVFLYFLIDLNEKYSEKPDGWLFMLNAMFYLWPIRIFSLMFVFISSGISKLLLIELLTILLVVFFTFIPLQNFAFPWILGVTIVHLSLTTFLFIKSIRKSLTSNHKQLK